jgi:hypothetical protein
LGILQFREQSLPSKKMWLFEKMTLEIVTFAR